MKRTALTLLTILCKSSDERADIPIFAETTTFGARNAEALPREFVKVTTTYGDVG
jgi:uncharacterized protein (DUF111 family)